MKLTEKAIELLTETGALRLNIALLMDCSESTVRRWINENEPNGDLTKFEVIQLIRKETGLQIKELYKN